MGSAAPKKRPMRSRRSGIKKLELVKANLSILKKLAAILILILFVGCEPVRYVNVHSHHNYYQRHRINTYTAPIWIPGRGPILRTYTVPVPRTESTPRQPRRGKH
jgi:hypothetical protein